MSQSTPDKLYTVDTFIGGDFYSSLPKTSNRKKKLFFFLFEVLEIKIRIKKSLFEILGKVLKTLCFTIVYDRFV